MQQGTPPIDPMGRRKEPTSGGAPRMSMSFGAPLGNVDPEKMLQAAIIADVDAERFMPLTSDRPSVRLVVVVFRSRSRHATINHP